MTFWEKIILSGMAVLVSLLLSACGQTQFTVPVLVLGEGGVQITGEALRQVPYGEDVTFSVSLPQGESVVQVFLDDVPIQYTYEKGLVTLSDVTSPGTLRIVSGMEGEKIYWDVTVNSQAGGSVRTNVQGPVSKGSTVTMTAVPSDGAVFLGWTERFSIKGDGKFLSAEEQLTVTIDDYTVFYANFDTSGVTEPETVNTTRPVSRNALSVYYNINGGNTLAGDKAALETSFDTSYWTMPFAREDDGRMTKDGYVLLGYSYAADGSGELIRPGHKYSRMGDDKMLTLYCVWQKETDPADFTVTDMGGGALRIDSYNGSDPVVYIPRTIDGKTVSRIASDAFAGNQALREVHITSSVTAIGKRAFGDCPNLTTVTIYDNVTTVSDESFAGSPVDTVHLCAATPPRYLDGGITYGKKFERLMDTAGTPRVVFVSGSSKHCGLDTDYLEELIPEAYSVVNFGTNATMNITLFLESVSSYLTEDDILVYCPEQYGPYAYYTNGNPEIPASTFQGIASCYNLFERIDITRYENVFDTFCEYVNNRLKLGAVAWDSHSTSIDEYGDYAPLPSTLQSPDFHYGANGDFRFDETVIPAQFLPNMNRVLDKADETGAQILFGFPPHNRNAVLPDSLDEQSYDAYHAFLRENVHAMLISDVRHYVIPGEYFFDTDYHLNTVGREMHTRQLAEDLIAAGVFTE